MTSQLRSDILLIDDEVSFLNRMMSVLGKDFYCHTAANGEDGLLLFGQLRDLKPLVICDVDLPGIGGFEVCRRIKSESPDTYVILLTNYNDNHSRMSGLKVFADQYLDKVTSDDELHLLIRNCCRTLSGIPDDVASEENASEIAAGSDFELQVKKHILAFYTISQKKRKQIDLSSKSIADQMNMAHRTFQREMKNNTGYSYKQLHAIVRLERSRELFGKGYNVTQVSDYLCFSNPAHLSRSFKEQFGITPSKYRRQLLGE